MGQKKKNILLIIYTVFSILYVIPSIAYILIYKSNSGLIDIYKENYFFITTNKYELTQAALLLIILSVLFIFFSIIIKNAKQIFKNKKSAFIFVFIIQIIFSFGIQVNSSDIFCYLGVGRLFEKYRINPYYQTIHNYIDTEAPDELDEVLKEGYKNVWSDTRISYGPIHLFIFSIITRISFGKIDLAILLSKILMIMINMLMCELIFRFFNKNINYVLMYGINPFVTIVTVVNCHNDSIFLLFIMLALYYAIKKEKILPALLFLSLSVNIKYVSLIFLPHIILYCYRRQSISKRMLYCIVCSILFAELTILPWLPFYRDLNVFSCFFDQIGRDFNSIYVFINEYIPDYYAITLKITSVAFVAMYIIHCFKMLFKKEFDISKNLTELFFILLFFLYFVTTNMQYWYFIWFYTFIYFFKKKEILLILVMYLISVLYFAFYVATYHGFEITATLFCIMFFIYGICSIQELYKNKNNAYP